MKLLILQTDGMDGRMQSINMPALGRRFQLGDLYNYRNDFIIQRDRQIDWEKAISVNQEFRFKFTCLNSKSENNNQWTHMGLDEHTQVSVSVGMIDNDFKGASSYLNCKPDATKASVTLACRIKTRKEYLDVVKIANFTKISLLNRNKTEATHIVAGVTYGAEFYCVLNQDIDHDAREQIEINLTKLAMKIKNALEQDQDFSQLKNQWPSNTNCRLYVDLLSQDDSSSDVEKVFECCLKLIKQMKETADFTESKAIPLTIRLCPLKLVPDFVSLGICKVVEYRDVDAELAARICRLFSKLEDRENQHVFANCSPIIQSALNEFWRTIAKYKTNLKVKLKQVILTARSTPDGTDAKVEQVVNSAERNLPNLDRWLRWKQEESEMVANIVTMTGLSLFQDRNQLNEKLFAKNSTLVLFIPSLDKRTDRTLQVMKNVVDSFDDWVEIEELEELPWYLSHQKRQDVFAKIHQLTHHAEINNHLQNQVQFCIAFEGTECSYSIYEHGKLVKSQLDQLPASPTGLRIDRDLISSDMKTVKTQPFSICLKWDYEDWGFPCRFLVQFRLKRQSEESWVQLKETKPGEKETTIKMERQPPMEVRVAADTFVGRSEFSDVIDTELEFKRLVPDTRRIAEIFATESDKSQLIRQGQPNVYRLNARDNSVSSDLRWFQTGWPNHGDRDHKVIILMGATGSGKSTLIEGIVNYIFGVEWGDPFRFTCVREDDCVTRNQAHSQTSSVTAYTIHHQEGMAVPYSITLIDTPGYGDTRGIGRDKEITDLIHRFLMGKDAQIDHIHAACFVAASGDSRLTATQRYILNSVLSIFGKDFKENIRLLVTFADNATPPVVEACRVANFPVTSQSAGISYSKFNSSVLYSENTQDDFNFDQLFWDMGQENFAKFFTMLEKMGGKDLKSTREVIQHRKQLENSLKQIERELEKYFVQIENLRWGGGRGSDGVSVAEKSNQMKANMLRLLSEMDNSISSLKLSALHWSGFSLSDYLSLMSSRVAEEQKPGYEIRLETLAELQELISNQEVNLPKNSTITSDEIPIPTQPAGPKRRLFWIGGVLGATFTVLVIVKRLRSKKLEIISNSLQLLGLFLNQYQPCMLPQTAPIDFNFNQIFMLLYKLNHY